MDATFDPDFGENSVPAFDDIDDDHHQQDELFEHGGAEHVELGMAIGDRIDPSSDTAYSPDLDVMHLTEHMPTINDLVNSAPSVHIPELDDPHPVATPTPAPPPMPAPEPPHEPAPEKPQEPDVIAPVPGVPSDGIYGSPDAISDNWFYQEVDGYCGPSSAAQIVSEYTGLDIKDPEQLAQRSSELGLWADGDPTHGMTVANLEVLLEDQGVPCHIEESSMTDLKTKLENGYGVIAMVDSGEIWHPEQEAGEDNAPDHALVVSGIDEARGVVILSDPGSPNGNQETVPIAQFQDAWADSGNEMLVADAPDADLADTTKVDPTAMAIEPKAPWAIVDLTRDDVQVAEQS